MDQVTFEPPGKLNDSVEKTNLQDDSQVSNFFFRLKINFWNPIWGKKVNGDKWMIVYERCRTTSDLEIGYKK